MNVEVTSQQTRFGFPTVSLRLFLPEIQSSWRTGYVGVPPTHPMYQMDYMFDELAHIDCWGGLTFSRPSLGIECIDEQFPEIWWFGFDCNHAQDDPRFGGTIKDLAFVEKELDKLAQQLQEIANAA